MAAELFFIYDSHCPWSYATTPLVNAVNNSLPEVVLNLWHCAYFSDADDNNVITKQQIISRIETFDIFLSFIGVKRSYTQYTRLLCFDFKV